MRRKLLFAFGYFSMLVAILALGYVIAVTIPEGRFASEQSNSNSTGENPITYAPTPFQPIPPTLTADEEAAQEAVDRANEGWNYVERLSESSFQWLKPLVSSNCPGTTFPFWLEIPQAPTRLDGYPSFYPREVASKGSPIKFSVEMGEFGYSDTEDSAFVWLTFYPIVVLYHDVGKTEMVIFETSTNYLYSWDWAWGKVWFDGYVPFRGSDVDLATQQVGNITSFTVKLWIVRTGNNGLGVARVECVMQ